MRLQINGASRGFDPLPSVEALVEAMGYAGRRIAIELNGEIVPKSRYAETPLKDGDQLEIVVAVGGG